MCKHAFLTLCQFFYTFISNIVLGYIKQYYNLAKEIELIKLNIAQNYVTNKSIEKLAQSQESMLAQLIQIRIDYATLFERERHLEKAKETIRVE